MVVVRFCYQSTGGVVEDELVLTCTITQPPPNSYQFTLCKTLQHKTVDPFSKEREEQGQNSLHRKTLLLTAITEPNEIV